MELDLIRNDLRKVLKESRYRHSIGVEEVSYDLALINGYNTEKATIAGILHDCAKYLTDEELLKVCAEYRLPVTDTERHCAFLLHAKVGAEFARVRYGVEDEEILSAIAYHTTGRPAMSMLEKIIFTADYIEPYRRPLPKIHEIRIAAYQNIDLGVYMITENVLNYLKETGGEIDTLTVDTYEYYKTVLQAQ